jgi:TolB-like protein
MKNPIPILALLLAATAAQAANTLAVLEIIPKSELDSVSITEMRHLTDELRRQAVLALPREGYTVLTRDNIIALIPPDEEEAECLAQSCAVDIGRAIGAEYISQGSIGNFGGELSVSIELYETMSGKLLGSIVMESRDVRGLLVAIREQAPALFARINVPQSTQPAADLKIESQKLESSQLSILNSQLPAKKTKPSTWVAISLDVLGAAALGFGAYQHMQKGKLYKDYEKMPDRKPAKEYDSALEKANDAQDLRDIGFIAGGALLTSGIAAHIWF